MISSQPWAMGVPKLPSQPVPGNKSHSELAFTWLSSVSGGPFAAPAGALSLCSKGSVGTKGAADGTKVRDSGVLLRCFHHLSLPPWGLGEGSGPKGLSGKRNSGKLSCSKVRTPAFQERLEGRNQCYRGPTPGQMMRWTLYLPFITHPHNNLMRQILIISVL